jgi:hypothetical protein
MRRRKTNSTKSGFVIREKILRFHRPSVVAKGENVGPFAIDYEYMNESLGLGAIFLLLREHHFFVLFYDFDGFYGLELVFLLLMEML